MMSFFKRLFGAGKASKNSSGEDAKVDFEVKDLQKGYILDYDLRTWEVKEVSVYTWDNGVKEYEYDIFDGREKLYLGYAPSDDQLHIFSEGKVDEIWSKARSYMRTDSLSMRSGEFKFEGKDFVYAAEGTARIKNSIEKFEMQNWLYESTDGEMLISFNKYEDGMLGAFVGKPIQNFSISNILPRG